MTLMRLRRGFDVMDLATRFDVSTATESRVIQSWTLFLAKQLEFLIKWPTREQLQNRPISAFKYFPSTIAIIDCTEFTVQRAKSTSIQRQTWSNYKHRNTLKLLVSCSASGTITFVSKLYSGNISDKEIVSTSGFLDKIAAGDNVMADRGFLIREVLALKGAHLNIPPFAHGKQLSMHATTVTRRIAKARIIVERAIGRLKEFKVLDRPIPLNNLHYIDSVVKVCACMCNLQPCLSSI